MIAVVKNKITGEIITYNDVRAIDYEVAGNLVYFRLHDNYGFYTACPLNNFNILSVHADEVYEEETE